MLSRVSPGWWFHPTVNHQRIKGDGSMEFDVYLYRFPREHSRPTASLTKRSHQSHGSGGKASPKKKPRNADIKRQNGD
jgi:hypothetical protein